MKKWRFIFSGHHQPPLNMAIDETLLDLYLLSPEPTLRIYGWEPHGFSLGCSQEAELVLHVEKCIKDNIPFVKRATGGGIIFHGNEVTYSLVCSEEDIGFPPSVKDAYRIICSFLMESYKRLGLQPCFAMESPEGRQKIKSTFCFSSFEDYDILVRGKKIGGNAQKRKKKIILQHGSVPLSLSMSTISRYVKEPLMAAEKNSISLEEAAGRNVPFGEFADVMRESFISAFDARLEKKAFSEEECALIKEKLAEVERRI
jgi:lipoyl(octanoyl) transferase